MSFSFDFGWSRLPLAALTFILAVFVTMAQVESASAKPRPTVDSPNGDTCWGDPDTSKDTDPDSLIISCCYDDGCWVCGISPLPGDACEWEQASRTDGNTGPITINPGGGRPLPGWLDAPDGNLSVSPGEGRRIVNICMAFDDHRLRVSSPNATLLQCCSRDLNYCVECPQTMNGACGIGGFKNDWANRIDGIAIRTTREREDEEKEPQCDGSYCGPLF